MKLINSIIAFMKKKIKNMEQIPVWINDEILATKNGCQMYNDIGSIYPLRRDIHRLEKGLSHKHLRFFGSSYINKTVERYGAYLTKNPDPKELNWIGLVLDKYFAAFEREPELKVIKEQYDQMKMSRNIKNKSIERRIGRVLPYEAFLEHTQSRGSLRDYQATLISDENIRKLLEVNILSPSACNRQSTRFIFLRNSVLNEFCCLLPGAKTFADKISNLVVLVGDLAAFPTPQDRHTIYLDGGISAAYFILTAKTLQMDTCIINWPDVHEHEVVAKKMLGLSSTERVILSIAFGYPTSAAEPLLSTRCDAKQRYSIQG